MTLKLPDLPYAYDALAPFMSAETLEFHHDKHHLAYVENGNKLLAGSKYEGQSLEDIVKNAYADKVPASSTMSVSTITICISGSG